MAADALVPVVARSSAAMVLTAHEKWFLVFHREGFSSICSISVSRNANTVGTPYNTNVGVQKIPDRAIWKPMVAKRNNTNP